MYVTSAFMYPGVMHPHMDISIIMWTCMYVGGGVIFPKVMPPRGKKIIYIIIVPQVVFLSYGHQAIVEDYW